jgi:predicted metal-dependent hydrolase
MLIPRLIPKLMPRLRRAEADPPFVTIHHVGQSFEVTVKRHPRARRYSLRQSNRDGEIILTLPARGRLESAKSFAQSQASWIATRVMRKPARIPFSAGALVPYGDVPHRIVHRPAPRGVVTPATDANGDFILAVYGEAAHVSRRAKDFLKKEAKKALDIAVLKHTQALGVPARKITVKDTISRWGSCSPDGRLNFSWRLIMAPPFVLDYLAAHEVAHLKELNHSARYWRIVEKLDPNWRAAEAWLTKQGMELHRYG